MSGGIITLGGVAELKLEGDVAGELKIRPSAMMTMELIADRGGEIPFDWNRVKQATRDMIADDLILAGFVKEVEYVTDALQAHGRSTLRLTDKGRNVVEIHRKRKLVASSVKEITIPAR